MKFLVDNKVAALRCCFFFFSTTTGVKILLLNAFLMLLPSVTFSQKSIDSTSAVSTVNQYISKYDSVIVIKISANSEYDFL